MFLCVILLWKWISLVDVWVALYRGSKMSGGGSALALAMDGPLFLFGKSNYIGYWGYAPDPYYKLLGKV